MSIRSVQTRRRESPSSDLNEQTAEDPRERIEALYERRKLALLRAEALGLADRVEALQQYTGVLQANHEALREQVSTLLAHEHYRVVITDVSPGNPTVVEVAGLGPTRVRVAVHAEIPLEELVVGAVGLVSRQKNCLLQVLPQRRVWSDVAHFERYLPGENRVLVRDGETLLVLDVAHGLRDGSLKQGDLIGWDRDIARLAYERIERPDVANLFDETVTDDFTELAGLDREIAQLKQHIDFCVRHPELSSKYGLRSKRTILLSGAPGNGKTRLARCCAGHIRRLFPDLPCRFMHVAASTDFSMWFGRSEQKIAERFAAVREAAREAPVVMFWDEVDALARLRGTDFGSGAPDRVLNTFLCQLDGIVPLKNVVVIYATNRADMLDPGLLRPGRTDVKIQIPAPNRQTAGAILRRYLDQRVPIHPSQPSAELLTSALLSRLFSPNGEYAQVASVKLSDGRKLVVAGRELLSGAVLENMVLGAAQRAAVREAESGQEGLTEDDLVYALDAEMQSAIALLTPGNVKRYVPSLPQDAQPVAVERK